MPTSPSPSVNVAERGAARRALVSAAIWIALAGVALMAWQCIHVLLLAFGGLILAAFLTHLSRLTQRLTRMPYWLALTVICVGLFGISVGLAFWLGPRIANQCAALVDEVNAAAQDWLARLQNYEWGQQILKRVRETGPDGLLSGFRGAFASATGAGAALILMLFVGVYVAATPGKYARGAIRLAPVAVRERTQTLLQELSDTLWWWSLGRILAMTIIGGLTALGLWLLGIPLPGALGVFAGLMTFIPNIGPVLAVAPAALLALEQNTTLMVYVLAYYTALQTVESYLITPLVQQRAVKTPPALLIVVQFVMAILAGITGLALATPLLAVAIVLVRRLYVEDVLERRRAGDARDHDRSADQPLAAAPDAGCVVP